MTMLSDAARAKIREHAKILAETAEACGASLDEFDGLGSLYECIEDTLITVAELGMRDVLENS